MVTKRLHLDNTSSDDVDSLIAGLKASKARRQPASRTKRSQSLYSDSISLKAAKLLRSIQAEHEEGDYDDDDDDGSWIEEEGSNSSSGNSRTSPASNGSSIKVRRRPSSLVSHKGSVRRPAMDRRKKFMHT